MEYEIQIKMDTINIQINIINKIENQIVPK